MNREIILTADGSTTIKIKDWDEQYHSLHGAIAEANHVFIANGLKFTHSKYVTDEVNILELGFGTGLNAWLTALQAETSKINIKYTGIEAFPISVNELHQLNFSDSLGVGHELFNIIHDCKWEQLHKVTPNFSILKKKIKVEQTDWSNAFNLIYFDAFGYRVQPELWTTSIFQKMYSALKPKGVLVTYSAKGIVRRSMLEVGFKVEKLPGPPGKREMLRAIKE